MKTRLLLATLLGFASLGHAADQRFGFALPEYPGRISFGVFDGGGNLVRVLYKQAAETDFGAGLDGLIGTWDGKNDAGEALPAGHYAIRGFYIGDEVKSEGEAFHFNDWVESEATPAVVPQSVEAAAGKNLTLSCRSPKPATAAKEAFSAENSTALAWDYVLGEGFGRPAKIDRALSPVSALWEGSLYSVPSLGETGLRKSSAPFTVSSPVEGAPNVALVDANAAALVCSDHKSVWVFRGKTFEAALPASDLNILSLSAGVRETFWIIAEFQGLEGVRVARQYSFQGELLRQLTDVSGSHQIFADKNEEKIYLSQDIKGGYTIRGLGPVADAKPGPDSKVVDWEVFLDKTALYCDRFGLVDGKLVADSGAISHKKKVSVDLEQSSFQASPTTVKISAHPLDGVVWLESADGIPLLPVSTLVGANRCLLDKAGANSIRLYTGNGCVVAEYTVSGLNQIAPIDGGDIELP